MGTPKKATQNTNDSGKAMRATAILAGANDGYGLELFSQEEISTLEISDRRGKPYLKCFITGRERPAKPEEIVRQLFVRRLLRDYGYPTARVALEKGVYFGSAMAEKRADIVVAEDGAPDTAYIIVECKKPKRRDGLEQLRASKRTKGVTRKRR